VYLIVLLLHMTLTFEEAIDTALEAKWGTTLTFFQRFVDFGTSSQARQMRPKLMHIATLVTTNK
jgi:hypothetical protein